MSQVMACVGKLVGCEGYTQGQAMVQAEQAC